MTASKLKGPDYFVGNERLELFPFIATWIRKGTPELLAVNDRARVLESVRNGNFEEAKRYLEMLHYSHTGMLTLVLEWAFQWPSSFANLKGAGEERRCTDAAFQNWQKNVGSVAQSPESKRSVGLMSELFSPQALHPGTVARYRKEIEPKFRGTRTIAGEFLRAVGTGQKTSNELLQMADAQGFEQHFTQYWEFVRSAHDAIVQYAQSYPETARQLYGQKAAEELIHQSFVDCSFFELLWTLLHAIDSHELAAFYSDHMRTHFSGRERGGAIQIIETEDSYRLVFDACGSGGAMRRRLAEAGTPVSVLPEASPATWGLAGQVPEYCSHCAFNELESIKRFGFPVAITEFDPDPFKPCGWTIFKDPTKIPERYFERLGVRKDPSQFKKDNLKYKMFRFLGDTLGLKKRVELTNLLT